VRKIKLIARLILLCTVCIIVVYTSNNLYQTLFNVDKFEICHNGHISITSCEMISTTLADTFQSLSFHGISQKIKNSFPFIKNISCAQLPTKELIITLEPYEPLYVINNDLILIESGNIVSKNMYDEIVYKELVNITYEQPLHTSVNKSCFTCLNSLNRSIFDAYDLTWTDDNEILLIDKKHRRFAIYTDMHSLEDLQKINHCSSLKTKITETKEFSLEKRKIWFADIRFDNQIVIFSRGGRGHGYAT